MIIALYIIAAIFNLHMPHTGVASPAAAAATRLPGADFAHCLRLLWRDKLGQISLATTTLFWGAGASLPSSCSSGPRRALGYTLDAGDDRCRRRRDRHRARRDRRAKLHAARPGDEVIPVGIAMGLLMIGMNVVTNVWVAALFCSSCRRARRLLRRADERAAAAPRPHPDGRGPLDRGAELQREPEHPRRCSASYSLLIKFNFSIYTVIVLFGVFVAVTMTLVRERHYLNLHRARCRRYRAIPAIKPSIDAPPRPRRRLIHSCGIYAEVGLVRIMRIMKRHRVRRARRPEIGARTDPVKPSFRAAGPEAATTPSEIRYR